MSMDAARSRHGMPKGPLVSYLCDVVLNDLAKSQGMCWWCVWLTTQCLAWKSCFISWASKCMHRRIPTKTRRPG